MDNFIRITPFIHVPKLKPKLGHLPPGDVHGPSR
jgi:hypothetical protein